VNFSKRFYNRLAAAFQDCLQCHRAHDPLHEKSSINHSIAEINPDPHGTQSLKGLDRLHRKRYKTSLASQARCKSKSHHQGSQRRERSGLK
jgi:hypothetical protein